MGYTTSWPGPWYVVSPPRGMVTISAPRAASASAAVRKSAALPRLPMVYTDECCAVEGRGAGEGIVCAAAVLNNRSTGRGAGGRRQAAVGRRPTSSCSRVSGISSRLRISNSSSCKRRMGV